MERLNLAILNQATTSGACPPSHHAHPPAAAGSFSHPQVVGQQPTPLKTTIDSVDIT